MEGIYRMNNNKIFGIVIVCLIISTSIIQLTNNKQEHVRAKDYGSFIEYLNDHPDVAYDLHPYLYVNEETDYPTYLHYVFNVTKMEDSQ